MSKKIIVALDTQNLDEALNISKKIKEQELSQSDKISTKTSAFSGKN